MVAPNPKDFYAEWHDSGGGARKASRNLWVFDKATGHKRYSITTSAGAKIQPYFDVPPPNDTNVYLFTVIGEVIGVGMVRVWLCARLSMQACLHPQRGEGEDFCFSCRGQGRALPFLCLGAAWEGVIVIVCIL